MARASCSRSGSHPHRPPYPEQFHDEDQGLWCPLQLVQVIVARAVVVKHVAHATAVLLAFQRVPSLCDPPHAPGDQGIHACVLQEGSTPLSPGGRLHPPIWGSPRGAEAK